MERLENIFFNLAKNENTMTELLCNILRFDRVRQPIFELLLSPKVASQIRYEDIKTQTKLTVGNGRPDIEIINEIVRAFVEVKVNVGLGCTENQPGTYIKELRKGPTDGRLLFFVFLVPKRWKLRKQKEAELRQEGLRRSAQVQSKIVFWEDVLETLRANPQARSIRPILDEYEQLLSGMFIFNTVEFSSGELDMLYAKGTAAGLLKLYKLVDEFHAKGAYPKSRIEGTADEFGFYFNNERGEMILWFGIWMQFWQVSGSPLCFGIQEDWLDRTSSLLKTLKKQMVGRVAKFPDTKNRRWFLCGVPRTDLESPRAQMLLWDQLDELLQKLSMCSVA